MKIIDAHIHLWDTEKLDYPWLEEVPPINRPFVEEDFYAATKQTPMDGFVFVQCECKPAQALYEVRWVKDMADKGLPVKGIVAYYPAEKGKKAQDYLEELAKFPLVVGVRRQYNEGFDFATSPDFIEGVQLLSDFDYTFDLCFDYTQIKETIEIVQRCPEITFIVDHLGKPGIQYDLLDEWVSDMKTLAQHPKLYAKISGLLTEARPDQAHLKGLEPWLNAAWELFGPEYLMYGGDWPVVNLQGSYQQWLELVAAWMGERSQEEKQQVFVGTAEKVYQL